MIGYKSSISPYEIGVAYMPKRRKPCLAVMCGNKIIKYATFNNEETARAFMNIFAAFTGAPLIDWNGDDIPIGLMENPNEFLEGLLE